MANKRIPLFGQLEIETSARCNRTCSGCIRNSHPDRELVQPWFDDGTLSTMTIERLFKEAIDLGFSGFVCLQHYNEPLLDARISTLGRQAKGLGFSHVFTCTNADFITEEKATDLDGAFDELLVALYMSDPNRSRREAWLRTLFKQTRLTFTNGVMIPTHYSPLFDVEGLAEQHRSRPCTEPTRRLIINHRGEMLMCCDDVIGNFRLGNVYVHSLEDLWWSERHQELVLALETSGGRSCHTYCQSCPRP